MIIGGKAATMSAPTNFRLPAALRYPILIFYYFFGALLAINLEAYVWRGCGEDAARAL
jgi:hypothetical protein